MGTIRWGIIGCGDVCERKSGPPLYELPHCELKAVTRRDAAAGQSFAERHGPSAYEPTVAALLARGDLDAIYVASPAECHREHALAAAASGRHVLVEKPMAVDVAECDDIITACDTAGVILGVAYYRRCYPSILAAKSLLETGAIGAPRRLWINDQFPLSHRIDLARFLLGEVEGQTISDEALPPDSCSESGPVLHCTHARGAESVLGVGWAETHDVEQVVISGAAGRIVVGDLKGGRMWLTRDGRTEARHQPPLPWTHQGIIDQFARHLLGEAPNPCSGPEGRASTAVLDQLAVGDSPVRFDP